MSKIEGALVLRRGRSLWVAEAECDVPQRHGGRSDGVVLRPLSDEPVRQAGDDCVGHGMRGRVDLHHHHLRQSELDRPSVRSSPSLRSS